MIRACDCERAEANERDHELIALARYRTQVDRAVRSHEQIVAGKNVTDFAALAPASVRHLLTTARPEARAA